MYFLSVNSGHVSNNFPCTDILLPITLTGNRKDVENMTKNRTLHVEIMAEGRLHWVNAWFIRDKNNQRVDLNQAAPETIILSPAKIR